MFEVGWSEILVIAIVALIVFPTKDLPRLLRTVGQRVGKARRMAGDFQSQFNTVLREAERELDAEDIKTSVSTANPLTDLRKTLDPIRAIGDDLKRAVNATPSITPVAAAAASPVPAEAVPVPPPEGAPALSEPPAAGPVGQAEPAASAPQVAPKDASAP